MNAAGALPPTKWSNASSRRLDLEALRRHRWVKVRAEGHAAVAATCAGEGQRDTVMRWLGCGFPLVARSRQDGDAAGRQPVGLCLPQAQGKVRIALSIAHEDIARIDEPITLDAVASVLSRDAREVALELAAHARTLGFTARAFGSAAWQWRTGETYLSSESDLDILAAPHGPQALAAWLERLRHLEARTPMRLDGEVEGQGGDAVNWRELAGNATELLVKSSGGARLAPRISMVAAWN